MTAITKFEDLIAWQEARKLVGMIYKITSDGLFSKDFGLKDQIQRAAVSSMTNIAEGLTMNLPWNSRVFWEWHVVPLLKCNPYSMSLWMQTMSRMKLSRPITTKLERFKPSSAD